ncbi:MAG: hypothetical protein ACPGUV_01645, partial [Polyangiales bacterium]
NLMPLFAVQYLIAALDGTHMQLHAVLVTILVCTACAAGPLRSDGTIKGDTKATACPALTDDKLAHFQAHGWVQLPLPPDVAMHLWSREWWTKKKWDIPLLNGTTGQSSLIDHLIDQDGTAHSDLSSLRSNRCDTYMLDLPLRIVDLNEYPADVSASEWFTQEQISIINEQVGQISSVWDACAIRTLLPQEANQKISEIGVSGFRHLLRIQAHKFSNMAEYESFDFSKNRFEFPHLDRSEKRSHLLGIFSTLLGDAATWIYDAQTSTAPDPPDLRDPKTDEEGILSSAESDWKRMATKSLLIIDLQRTWHMAPPRTANRVFMAKFYELSGESPGCNTDQPRPF